MTRKTITRVETVVECVFDAEYEHDILKIFELSLGPSEAKTLHSLSIVVYGKEKTCRIKANSFHRGYRDCS